MEKRILFTGSVSERDVEILDQSTADWWVNLSNAELTKESLSKLTIHNGDYRILNIHYGNATDKLFDLTEKYGFGLSLWTANDEEVIRRIMMGGAMNVTTRHPLLALKIRKELFGK